MKSRFVDEEKIILDFKNVNFVTPSFIAELNTFTFNKKDVEFEIVNLSDTTKRMFEVVASRSKKKSKVEPIFKKNLVNFDLKDIYV